MSDTINGESKKLTPLELKPKWSIRVCHTPNKGRDYYTVSYRDEFGKRQRKLFPDQSKAEAEAEKLQRKMNHGVAPGILLNGRDRLIYERAIEAIRPTGIDLDIVTKDAVQALSILGQGSLAEAARFYVENHINVVQKQVSEVVLELVTDREKNGRSSSYLRDLRTRLGNFADSFKCPIASVTPDNIEAYLDSTGATGHYRKNLRDAVGTLFNFARKRKYVQKDHPGVSPITKPSLVPHEVKIFAPEDFAKLLTAVPDRLVPALALGGFTALRTAEIERLDWSQINLREGHIEIKARMTKKKIRRIVPIPANLKRWLLPFHQPNGRVSPYKLLSNQWAKFANRAGVQWSRNILRDSGISYRVALTGNANLVALESGNSVGVILSNYLKCVPKSAAKKWYKINSPGRGKLVTLPSKANAA